jgi:hypothetical protein
MTAEDDRRFLELTNDLTHNAKVSGAGTAALGHNVELSGPEGGIIAGGSRSTAGFCGWRPRSAVVPAPTFERMCHESEDRRDRL